MYRRTIPKKLRPALGGMREFARALGTSTERFTSKEFRRAYSAAQAEAEALLKSAEQPAVALTERDSFGLMREVLLQMEMQPAPPQMRKPAPAVDIKAGLMKIETDVVVADLSADPEEAKAALKSTLQFEALVEQWVRSAQAADGEEQRLVAQMLDQTLARLGLRLTPHQKQRFLADFEQHKDKLLTARSKELEDLNFNSVGGVLEKLPEPPTQVTTWETLREGWITMRGGRRSETGRGLAPGSIDRADKHWSEIQMLTRVANPSDLTTDMVRQWIRWMQGRVVPATVLSNLKIIKAVFRAGVSEGLMKVNVTESLTVTSEEVEGYQPFEPYEIRMILEATKDLEIDYGRWLPRIALYTGARVEELAQLRRHDIRKINGVLCFDFVHRPEDELPTFLKGKKGSERQVPIHPWVQSEGFLEFCEGKEGRLFHGKPGTKKVGAAISKWHRVLLRKLDLWVDRKKVFHSYRGTFKDMCRRAGIDGEVHHAFTGHSPGNVGDRAYGMTLRKMPEVTVKQMVKLPTPDAL